MSALISFSDLLTTSAESKYSRDLIVCLSQRRVKENSSIDGLRRWCKIPTLGVIVSG